jgi:hypothetical protein
VRIIKSEQSRLIEVRKYKKIPTKGY